MNKQKYDFEELNRIRSEWNPDAVNEALMDEDERRFFLKRKKAVDLYCDGFKIKDICKETGMHQGAIYVCLERALTINPETQTYYGYAGLTYYARVHDSVRTDASSKGPYRFKKLMDDNPELEQMLFEVYFDKGSAAFEHNISILDLHKRMMKWLRQHNYTDDEYPFNTKNKGYTSLWSYVKRLERNHIRSAARRAEKNAAQIVTSTGYGEMTQIFPIAPYQAVQMDGHRVDCVYVVEVRNKDNEIRYMTAQRCWLILTIDVATRCVLGYSLTQEDNYDTTDVLQSFQNSVMPKNETEFTVPGLKVPEGGGWPDTVIPELEYSLPASIYLDNAKSHLSGLTRYKVLNVLGSTLSYGSVSTPETRGIVERFFRKMEEYGIHRLPSTTGSNPHDPKRKEAEKNAQKYKITFEIVCQILEWSIMMQNTRPNDQLDGMSPIDLMKARIKIGGMWPKRATDEQKRQISTLTYIYKEYTIKGNQKKGRRPYIHYENANYRGPIISDSFDYAGKTVILEINPRNISEIRVYSKENKKYIDTVKVTGQWASIPHSLQTRKWAQKYANEYRATYGYDTEDPLGEFIKSLIAEQGKSKVARTKLDIIKNDVLPYLDTDTNKGPIEIETKTEQPAVENQAAGEIDFRTVAIEELKKMDLSGLSLDQRMILMERLSSDEYHKLMKKG